MELENAQLQVEIKPDPIFSVCIPVYNGCLFLEETLDSIIAQNYDNLEIVIQDDASKDDSWALIESYAKKYPFVSAARNGENVGLSANWNKVVNRARGEYILVTAQDDLLEPGFIQNGLMIFRQYSVEAVSTNYFFLKDGQKVPGKFRYREGVYENFSFLVLLMYPFSINFTILKNTTVQKFKKNGNLFSSFYTSDLELFIRMGLSGIKIYYCAKRLGSFRLHSKNTSKRFVPMFRQVVLVIVRHHKSLKSKIGYFRFRLSMALLAYRLVRTFLKDRWFDKKLLKIVLSELIR